MCGPISYPCNPWGKSYSVKGKIEIHDNPCPSEDEIELMFRIDEYSDNSNSELRDSHPSLYEKIRGMVISGMVGELAKAKRARHIGNVIRYVENLASLPRYTYLAVDDDLAGCVPF